LTGLERGLQHVKALMAIKAGVDYLVVGRPILAGADPRAATQAIAAEIESAIK
jgi:orotidine-5'-phosphate decarboxylase